MSLALLVLTQVAPPLALDIAANYLAKMNLFLSRERNGIYDWTALVASLLIVSSPSSSSRFCSSFSATSGRYAHLISQKTRSRCPC